MGTLLDVMHFSHMPIDLFAEAGAGCAGESHLQNRTCSLPA